MRLIGLIGGMSWESTQLYYQLINRFTRERAGGLISSELMLHSVNFAPIAEWLRQEQWDKIGSYLASIANSMEAQGAEGIVLCTNTMHNVADQIQSAINVPFLHLADVTADALKQAQVAQFGFLGTRFTMEQDFFLGQIAARVWSETHSAR